MRWPVLALFSRALRLDARANATYAARGALVLAMLLAVFQARQSVRFQTLASGRTFFTGTMVIDMIFVMILGVVNFAAAITEEKEDQTLGLLMMTGLRPVAILLGKSTSRMMGAVFLLAAQFPFTLLAVTLGGIGRHQIVAAYLTVLAFLFLLANVALFASVVCNRTQAAVGVTFILIFAFLAGPSMLLGLLRLLRLRSLIPACGPFLERSLTLMLQMSPMVRLGRILGTGFSMPVAGIQVWSNLAGGIVFFALAQLLFLPCARRNKVASPSRVGVTVRRRSALRLFNAGRVWPNAVAWKEFHFTTGGCAGVLGRIAAVVGVVALFFMPRLLRYRAVRAEDVGYALFWWALVVGGIELAYLASRMFRVEICWKTLSTLMLLPIPAAALARQKIRGCLPAALPYIGCALLGVCLCREEMAEVLGEIFGDGTAFGFVVAAVLNDLLYICLCVVLSIRMPRGAMGLAAALMLLMYIGVFVFFSNMGLGISADKPGIYITLPVPLMVLAACGTLRELKRAAAG